MAWSPPAVLAPRWPYESPGPWDPANCASEPSPGAQVLRRYLETYWPVTTGGLDCRPNTAAGSQMSVHATGRALDVFPRRTEGVADHAVGTGLADWLVRHADAIGIPYIIWDRTQWNAQRGASAYTGPHPHDDHVHVELSSRAARLQTPWFTEGGPDTPPNLSAAGVGGGRWWTAAAVAAFAGAGWLLWSRSGRPGGWLGLALVVPFLPP